MKWTGLLVALMCATALLAAGQDDEAGIKTKIVALEKAWNQAYKMADIHALGEILDDKIVLINDDGSIQTKTEFLKSIKKSNSQEQQVSPESMNVNVYGNVAISTGVFRAKGTENGKPYVRRNRFVDTWIRKGGNWVCVASNATPLQ